jgi:uncharacterized membrane protein (UPF0182 family)
LAQSVSWVRRRWAFVVLGAVVLVAIVLSALSGFYIDLLWFREVHFASVFWRVFWSKVVLGLIFGLLFFLMLFVNLVIARRISPRFRAFSPEEEIIERYRAAFDPYAKFLIPGFAAFIALFVGIAASAQWQTFVLWRYAGSVGFGPEFADKVFHRDPGFYMFILPFHKYVQGWLFSSLVGVTLITGLTHYFTGGIRLQTAGEKVTPQVKAHLSVLLGLIVLVKAWGYYLGRFDLLVSPRGVVTGASYTDVHAQLPALTLLVFIALACAVLFLVNIRFRGWALPVLGIGLLALVSIIAGAIVPAVVQKFQVDPQELQRELTYIDRNITATRHAFGLDTVSLSATSVEPDVTSAQVAANSPTISNIRLWDPGILRVTYDNLQRIQPYYEFSDVDVDRYQIAGSRRVVMLSAREVRQTQIPAGGGTWQNTHLFYTHGYGAVASLVNTVTTEGQPVFVLKDIPPTAASGIPLSSDTGAQVYYSEKTDVPYVVVDSTQAELNYPDPSGAGAVTTAYQGSGGISIGSFFRQLLFAYRYRDINLLISKLIDKDSRILIYRDIGTRIAKAAPFLRFDKDPYAAIVDGRLVFVLDAYTTSDVYPYSQRLDLAKATASASGPDLVGEINYIRNSVKAVVDAYDGSVTLYVVDPTDPIIQVWMKVFPDLFNTGPVPEALLEHFRYPEDLLLTQASQYANYHVTDAETFYNKGRFWAVPRDPTIEGTPALRPYYVLLKLPGDEEEQFVLFMPFTPFQRPNMVAYMVGQSDPGQYGKLKAFEFTSEEPVDGPEQVFARINQDPTFSQQRALLGQLGSTVAFGNLLVVPVENSFLYVLPVYVISSQQSAIPELKRVLVVHGGTVSLGNTLGEALAASFGQPPPSGGGGGQPPTGDVAQLLAEAQQHFELADQLLTKGDLAGYQREINAGIALIEQANAISNPTATPTPTPTPTPTTSP